MGGSKEGARGAMAPHQRPDKNGKKRPNLQHFASLKKKKFPEGMSPDAPNLVICSVFLALIASGPLQCKRLEPPVL